ncbi:MAG TPA: cupin domain-containing protein [Nitrolancea sp.]|jgi:mannose-6-phosphate isomerase-like protein (cupin superfamily)
MPFVINEQEAPTRVLRGERGISQRLINPSTGSQHVDVHVNILRAGSGPGPYHYHSNAENIYYVLSGTARVTVDGVPHTAGPGVAVFIPPGERHDVENIGTDDLRVIEIKVPHDSDFIIVERDSVSGE